jgi:hypothetical protein
MGDARPRAPAPLNNPGYWDIQARCSITARTVEKESVIRHLDLKIPLLVPYAAFLLVYPARGGYSVRVLRVA